MDVVGAMTATILVAMLLRKGEVPRRKCGAPFLVADWHGQILAECARVKKAPGVRLLQTVKITVVHLPSTGTEHAQHCYRACLSPGPRSEIASPIALSATATEHGCLGLD